MNFIKKPETRPLNRLGSGLKRLGSLGGLKGMLAFKDDNVSPLDPIPKNLLPADDYKARMNALGKGLSGALKKQQDEHKEGGRADYYIVVCFAHVEQVEAFLQQAKYPDPEAMFIDGPFLAKSLGMEIPETKYKLKALRPVDRKLAALVEKQKK